MTSRSVFVQGSRTLATRLGYAGLGPFIACTAILALGPIGVRELTLRALLGYGAVILGFMGAIHWGRAMYLGDSEFSDRDRNRALVFSVLPALTGWSACLLAPRLALITLAVAFAGLYLFERRMLAADRLGKWYLPLRFRLTTVVIVCLVLSAVLL